MGDVFLADVGLGNFIEEVNLFRCIDRGAVAAYVVQFGMGAKRVVEPFEEFSQTLFHLVAEGRGVRTDGTFEVSIFDAYVVAGACIHEADGAYDIFHRVHLTGDECLHVDDEVGSGYESIRAIVRLRCVGGFPLT